MRTHLACLMVVALLLPLAGCGSKKIASPKSRTVDTGDSALADPDADSSAPTPEAESKTEVADTTPEASTAPATGVTEGGFEGGLVNGLFPQIGTDGFGGGLFPSGGTLEESSTVATAAGVPDDGASTTTSAPEKEVVTFLTKASDAFHEREEKDAFQYLYAHVLTADGTLSEYPLQWYAGLSQPRVAFRWGVGVVYSAPKNFDEKPPVPGDPAEENSRGNRRTRGGPPPGGPGGGGGPPPGGPGGGSGSSGPTDSPYKNVNSSHPEGYLLYYTGELGDRMLDEFESRRVDDAGLGALVSKIEIDYEKEEEGSSSSTPNPGSGGGGGSVGQFGGEGGGGGGRPAGAGGGGPAGANGSENTTSRVDRVSGSSAASTPDGQVTGTLVPGVMLVGEGSKQALVDRAKSMGLDGLIVFNVRVSSGKKTIGSCGVKVFNLHSAKEEIVFSSRTLKHDAVHEARTKRENSRIDPVQMVIKNLFEEGIDAKFKPSKLPGLKPKHVAKRISKVLAQDNINPLPAAIEILGFHDLKLMTDQEAIRALDKLFGKKIGESLVNGDTAKKTKALAAYLPEGWNQ